MANRKIYGVSSKFEFGKWDHVVEVFEIKEEASEWLETEQHDFRDRELMTKTAAIKLAGKEAVKYADEKRAFRLADGN